mmetsp:Transcript_12237/g.37034  ORF Transcript_12237/g.37034 Transcript_12237/m.37034 type:complete len:1054 (-) Transcript_12237:124-3285(-)
MAGYPPPLYSGPSASDLTSMSLGGSGGASQPPPPQYGGYPPHGSTSYPPPQGSAAGYAHPPASYPPPPYQHPVAGASPSLATQSSMYPPPQQHYAGAPVAQHPTTQYPADHQAVGASSPYHTASVAPYPSSSSASFSSASSTGSFSTSSASFQPSAASQPQYAQPAYPPSAPRYDPSNPLAQAAPPSAYQAAAPAGHHPPAHPHYPAAAAASSAHLSYAHAQQQAPQQTTPSLSYSESFSMAPSSTLHQSSGGSFSSPHHPTPSSSSGNLSASLSSLSLLAGSNFSSSMTEFRKPVRASNLSHRITVDATNFVVSPSMIDQWTHDQIRLELQKGALFDRVMKKGRSVKVQVYLSSDSSYLWVAGSSKLRINLREVDSLLLGQKSKNFESQKSVSFVPSLSMSLVFGYLKELCLVAENDRQFDLWSNGLLRIIVELQEQDSETAYLKKVLVSAGKDPQKPLNYHEVLQLLTVINCSEAPGCSLIMNTIREVDGDGNQVLDFGEIIHLLRLLRKRPEVEELFMRYTNGAHYMSCQQLHSFLYHEQRELMATPVRAQQLIANFEPSGSPYMTLFAFEQYLCSQDNTVSDPFHCDEVYHDMNRPLTEYFIDSSHNTYLESDQLTGISSVAQYIRVLKDGCRCVELDCWNGSDGQPRIYHGHTLTSKILFSDVIVAIRDYAFCASDYPLILSIENHCGLEQQDRMASILRETLGSMLAPPPPTLPGGSMMESLPSPEQLRHKILLKGPTASDEMINAYESGTLSEKTPLKVSPSLSRMIFLASQSYDGPKGPPKPWQMCSFAESAVKKEPAANMIAFCSKRLARVYPKGARVDSTNYNPVDPWIRGCQLVALNFQTPTSPMWLNQAKFSDNGGCGYILRPAVQRQQSGFDPLRITSPVPGNKVSKLVLHVLSARQLPSPKSSSRVKTDLVQSGKEMLSFLVKKSKKLMSGVEPPKTVHPYVVAKIHGLPADTRQEKTQIISGNGLNPEWRETFTFTFVMSEVAILSIRVKHRDTVDVDIAQYCIPVELIRPGYRILRLKDVFGRHIPMCDMLCKFETE